MTKKRHKWDKRSASKALCTVCGCHRNRSFIPPIYTMPDGSRSRVTPDCIDKNLNKKGNFIKR